MSNTALNAQKQRLKGVKHESHRVNTPRPKTALKSDLWEDLQVRPHPYLAGVKCREDGCIYLPQSGPHPGHWTYGHVMKSGYVDVVVKTRHYYVHRLMAEAFLGPAPDGCEIDHIDRDRTNNAVDNLRWITHVENIRHRAICARTREEYGFQPIDDVAEYHRLKYIKNKKAHAEKCREYYRTHRAERLAYNRARRAKIKAAKE